MNFRVQDLMKILIPGIITTFLSGVLILDVKQFTVLSSLIKDTMAVWILVFLSVVYLLGYFVDFLGSLLEQLFYKYFDKPSLSLLNEKLKRIPLSDREQIIEYLCEKLKRSSHRPFDKNSANELFKYANVLKDYSSKRGNEKISDYYFSKILSRNLSSSFLSTFAIYAVFFLITPKAVPFNVCSLGLFLGFFCTGYRWRIHSFYYSRQVFYTACENLFKS
ncbi:hypothetical protein [Sphingobacterium deserti]|uniref:Uncharacterized protein n=1 Tax=Sphingobacterium deserti TaxID=1229276 RepID=A0A0B8T487_9SPHI|nr:hypothetical protein [Sphingobacterium deserti]KGE14248.1 hypothetical protein DI53_2078 [Sphingobacterium deserti]